MSKTKRATESERRTYGRGMADIGKEEREITVEPIRLPERHPAPAPEPEREPAETPEREKVPA